MIGIINYWSGNIQAIANIFKQLNVKYKVISEPDELDYCQRIILPGVGAFDEVMKELVSSGFKSKLDYSVIEKKIPVLGICVGMQIMSEGSEEGDFSGLGWIKGYVKKFDKTKILNKPFIPHMGWNEIFNDNNHPIFKGVEKNLGFYFVHSYYFECQNKKNQLSYTKYGIEFSSSVYDKHIFGMQFHPEKSHSNGIKLLYNFANMDICSGQE